ncbi:IclR family transcriptional regulator [Bacillus alveayuensis]|uniref:IclR family transcriptional regulator n=1 Tax=Aeribacillus alveayuensis TaxID=279215 RepID=UPI000A07A624|nr:IclR family transcriptional regulator [Bacillus alveayuensis]
MEKNNYLITSVKNGLRILRLFSIDTPELGVTEISHQIGLNKSTVHRLIKTLEKSGFIEKNQKTRKYQLGLSLLNLSGIISIHTETYKDALPILESLVNQLGEAAHISVLEGTNTVYLHKVQCKHPVRLLSHIGKNNPCSCTSSGKVILSFQSEEVIESVISQGLPHCGPNSITDPTQFRNNLREIRQKGYSICIDELHEGVISIAAPIRDYSGEVVAAVSVVGPKQRIRSSNIPHFVEQVCKAGQEISNLLGYYGQ